ncbi:MBL fold metallo-hydrolase [Tranquillimonas alkanivorans]|uniref:L-ascorbate metabolism protein UlaG, beta-lactamase superfamily n=1 Tax=Tranquillimonas alkanivorans TaxID=441119 RepID=A0A1I5M6E1_9RHOB|nr:MBL fold metallo-hydrolase [Tranquillimonas alkanivorans]SFP05085.1 L-ascorbate metabolism protein UlaG, beta-lactamase superfamily [Tranquillimonas alkanivorans]
MRLFSVLAVSLASAATAASAQERRPSHCIAIADAAPGIEYLHRASWAEPVPDYEVRISYLDHSMFLIQTPGGLSAVTDYTGYLGPADFVPDVATMNHAHSSHWTAMPDERIPHVLKGWGDGRTPNEHHVDLGEMLVRNVPTDIRSAWDEGAEKYGNSIFVFEVEGMCIGHLGHLHHEPDEMQYAALGRVDVVMAAVDGGLTVDLPTMIRVLGRLKSSVVIPMHWFGRATLDRFLDGMEDDFVIERTGESSLTVGLRTLPDRPTVMVLEPELMRME